MAIFSPGFAGRRNDHGEKLPPGQYLERGFPVLTAGPTQRIRTDQWEFSIVTETGDTHAWNWQGMLELGPERIDTDIHCVTSWSKFGTTWKGVSIDKFLAGIETTADYVMATSYGGYTTNLPLAEITGGKAWVAYEFDGKDLHAEHGGPARLLVPALYFWKSAKWVTSMRLMHGDSPGFWEQNGYNMHGDPWREERYWGQ